MGVGKTDCDAESRAVDRWWGDAFVTSVEPEFLEISSKVILGDSTVQGAVSWSGDSGGPLLLDQDGGEWRVSAVLSKATCGDSEGDKAYYTNLGTYGDWIETVVSSEVHSVCPQEPSSTLSLLTMMRVQMS